MQRSGGATDLVDMVLCRTSTRRTGHYLVSYTAKKPTRYDKAKTIRHRPGDLPFFEITTPSRLGSEPPVNRLAVVLEAYF